MKFITLQKRIYGLLVLSLFFISCKETQNETDTPVTDTPAIENTNTEAVGNVNAAPAVNPAPAAGTTTAATPALNPPHGQPGHRCEIPVGAPLNSQPSNTAAPMQQPAQQPAANPAQSFMQPAATPQPATTAPGMNPPHGQPGHTCSVPVGAPLPK